MSKFPCPLDRADANLRLLGLFPIPGMPEQFEFLFRSQNEIDTLNPGEGIRLKLSVASHDHYIRSWGMAQGTANNLTAFTVGTLCHAAGIDHDNLGSLINAYNFEAALSELPRDRRGFRDIQFASQCVNRDAFHRNEKESPVVCEQLFCPSDLLTAD